MPKKKYIVDLNDEEREELQQLLRSGKHPTRKVTRAASLTNQCSNKRSPLGKSEETNRKQPLTGGFLWITPEQN